MTRCNEIVAAILRPSPPTGATSDVYHAGDPNTPVTGIAVMFQATVTAIAEAARLGANFIITHEPTFYDAAAALPDDDAVVAAKRAAIGSMVIWRCHDLMHRIVPDLIRVGVASALGWIELERPDAPAVYDLPPTTLGELCQTLKSKLGIDRVRVSGDARLTVKCVALSCGCPGWARHLQFLRSQEIDVLICGEAREWETYEYVRDSAAAAPKGLVVLGHAASEEAGMAHLAALLARQFPAIPVHFIPVGNAFRCV